MSLVSTLGKIAMGAIVAKGVGKMMGNRSQSGGGGLGGMLGGGQQGGGGLLGGLLGNALGGGQQGGQQGGGLADIIGGLTRGGQGGAGGALGGALGGLLGGQQGGSGAQAGGLGGLLNSLGGGQQQSSGGNNNLGDLLNQAFSGKEPEVDDQAEKQAEVLLSAMLSAAKCDGLIDDAERAKLTEHLGDVSPEEAAFVQAEMAKPVDVAALVASVPQGMEQQVYLMSLTAIDLDSQKEAEYLHELAQGLGINQQQANHIHEQLGVPTLYS